jgi:hypothetical protein
MDPEPRKKQLASTKRKDKGNPYASSKHIRIELENQYQLDAQSRLIQRAK